MGRWSAEAPFGRVGRRLDFRWVFPVGTMAVPFHSDLLPLPDPIVQAKRRWGDGGAGGPGNP